MKKKFITFIAVIIAILFIVGYDSKGLSVNNRLSADKSMDTDSISVRNFSNFESHEYKQIVANMNNDEIVIINISSRNQADYILNELSDNVFEYNYSNNNTASLPRAVCLTKLNDKCIPMVYNVYGEPSTEELNNYIIKDVSNLKTNDKKQVDLYVNTRNLGDRVDTGNGFTYGTEWSVGQEWYVENYLYWDKPTFLYSTKLMHSCRLWIQTLYTTYAGATYHAQMVAAYVTPVIENGSGYSLYGLDKIKYTIKPSPNETNLLLFDYAPKSEPQSVTETVSMGASGDTDGKLTVNTGVAYAIKYSDLYHHDETIMTPYEKMSSYYDVDNTSDYGKGSTSFNYLSIYHDSTNNCHVQLSTTLELKFYVNFAFENHSYTENYETTSITSSGHSYNQSYQADGSAKHRSYCECGRYILEDHVLRVDQYGELYCIKCQYHTGIFIW